MNFQKERRIRHTGKVFCQIDYEGTRSQDIPHSQFHQN